MTLEEYKSQCKAIKEETENFIGTPEEAVRFFDDLAKKYPEVNEFNTKALQCKDVTEFKKLADSVGMKFSDEDSAEKLYSLLDGTKKQLQIATKMLENGVKLGDDELRYVTGGGTVIWDHIYGGEGMYWATAISSLGTVPLIDLGISAVAAVFGRGWLW